MAQKQKSAIAAMSGGVDSSVSAWLMKKDGYNVMGVFLRLHEDCQPAEAAARRVCQRLGIRFYPINAITSFREEVIDYFLSAYAKGETPNPCVACNRAIKFGVLLKLLGALKGDCLFTGHYSLIAATTEPGQGGYRLKRGADKTKDQSYFLYTLTQSQLAKIKFPLGSYRKDEVRRIAQQNKLPYSEQESQDICFLGGQGRAAGHNLFLKEKLPLKPGLIKAMDGRVLGEHDGLPLYTVGQRRGVEIGGTGPYYVAKTDYADNTLYVVSDPADPALMSAEFRIRQANWIAGSAPALPWAGEAQVRYRHKPAKCRVFKLKSGAQDCYRVKLEAPVRAVTPGQSAVFYDGDELLGGGIIY